MTTTTAAITSFIETPPAACITLRASPDPPLILIGTYKLDEGTGNRTGSLLLYKLERELSKLTQLPSHSLSPSQGSILDIRLLPSHGLILVATSRGRVLAFTLTGDDQLNLQSEYTLFDESVLVLSLAIHPGNNDTPTISATLSDGSVVLLRYHGGKIDVVSKIEIAHNGLEVWTSAMYGGQLYTGGDDASLAVWDVTNVIKAKEGEDEKDRGEEEEEEEEEEGEEKQPTMLLRNKKTHEAGVTAILPLEVTEGTIVLTGSYDSKIRAYDSVGAIWIGELDLEGGVWRLQVLCDYTGTATTASGDKEVLVLASCMHAGCRLVKVTVAGTESKKVEFEVVGRMEEHESMNYASTAVEYPADGSEKKWDIVSTSFYDKRVCLWSC